MLVMGVALVMKRTMNPSHAAVFSQQEFIIPKENHKFLFSIYKAVYQLVHY